MSLVIDLIDLVAKHKAGELRCPATALIPLAPDWTPCSAASHLELYCLPMSDKKDARLK